MLKAWNPVLKCFGQSYEETHILDSSVLIMPLVFFIQPVSNIVSFSGPNGIFRYLQSDPRFVSTLKQILRTPDRGGLTSNVIRVICRMVDQTETSFLEPCLSL
jgi:GH15 family glucan-1,4-alpha-glucosidase